MLRRVNRERRCPVCGHDSWCGFSLDGGRLLVVCMRTPSGRPSANGGWVHLLEGGAVASPPADAVRDVRPVGEDARREIRTRYRRWLSFGLPLAPAAGILGLRQEWLAEYGAAATDATGDLVIPMLDCGSVVGVRVRRADGRKYSWPGSRNGLFMPKSPMSDGQVAVVAEGPTDAAALWGLGFYALGRPDCLSVPGLVASTLQRMGVSRAVIIADRDEPGIRGATKLAKTLRGARVSSSVLVPPDGVKDARDWAARDPDGLRSAVLRTCPATGANHNGNR